MLSKIHELIQEYFNNNYSDRIRKAFILWLKDPRYANEKDESIRKTWKALDKLDISADESTEKSYASVMSVIRNSVVSQRKQSIQWLRGFSRVAAILMLPVIAAGMTFYIMKTSYTSGEKIRFVECIVPDGEIRTVTLPDSSVVKVNSGSVLIYPRAFTTCRDVFLNGEAYFSVTPDAKKPFTVKTTDMDIEVLGTIFNVSSYANSESTKTTLESGKVGVIFKNIDQKPVTLFPKEQIVYNRTSGQIKKNKVKVENEIAWTEGSLIVQRMTVDELIKLIERKYALKVYMNMTNYKNERITIKVTCDETVEELMRVLQYLLPQLKYKLEPDKLFIY